MNFLRSHEKRRSLYSGFIGSHWSKLMRNHRNDADSCRKVLLRLRACFEFSQAEMAAVLNCSLDTIQSWESGRRNPSGPARTAIHLLEVLLVLLPDEDWLKAANLVWGDQLFGGQTIGVLLSRKDDAGKPEDRKAEYLDEFRSREPEEQAATIQELEKWVEQLKEILASSKTKSP